MSNLLRRAILALALIAGITPAFAQAPAAVPALADTERRTSYALTASTCACAVNFALYGDSTDYQNWLEVYIDGTKYAYNDATHGWTITVPTQTLATRARPISDAILTFNTAQTGTVQIVGARRPRRTSQFAENAGVSARNIDLVVTDLVAMERERWDGFLRTLRAPGGETLALLPKLADRKGVAAAGTILGFSGVTGDPITLTGSSLPISVIGTPGAACNSLVSNGPSAIPTFQSILPVNVMCFGAIANDATKYAENQAAFAAAFAVSSGVTCPSGVTLYTQTIAIPSAGRLLNLDCNLIAAGTYSASTAVVDIQTVTGGFALKGSGSITVAGSYPTISGIKAFGTDNTTIDGIAITGGFYGIQFGNQAFTTIRNTRVDGYFTRGIEAALAANTITITGNRVTGGVAGSDHAISIAANADKVTITNNQVFQSLGWSYSVQQTSNFTVCNNISVNSRFEAIVVGAGSSKGIVCDNTLTFGSNHIELGISMENTTDFVVSGNTLYLPHSSCLYFGVGIASGSVTGNNCTAPALRTVTGAANNGSGKIRLAVNSTAGMASGNYETIFGVVGTTEANDIWIIDVIDSTHIDLRQKLFGGAPSVFTNAYVSGGKIGDANWSGVAMYLGADNLSITGNKFRDFNSTMQFFVKEFDAPSGGNFISNNHGDAPQNATVSVQSTVSQVTDDVGMTVAKLPATVKNGSRIYTSDGLVGSLPITTGGTGAWAVRLNGVWQADPTGIPTVYTAGTGLTLTGTQFSLTSPVTAALGGTGQTSYTIGDLLSASGTTAIAKLAAGAAGNVLRSNGAGVQSSYGKVTSAYVSGTSNTLIGMDGSGNGAEITMPAAGLTLSAGALALANDLAALEGLSSTGFAVRTGSDAWAQRTLAAPAAGLTITNNTGVAGNPTFALANDLAALEGLGSTGIAVRSAADTWVQRSLAGTTNRITVTNGDGVSGNPTADISSSYVGQSTITTTGTLTSGATGAGFTLDFANSTLSGDLPFSALAQGLARSVLGVTGNATADVASIQATAASDAVLRESGSTVGFGTIATGGIANNAVTLAKLATQGANTVLANATSGAAGPTAFSVPSCDTATKALQWTTNTGFVCNTSITAAAPTPTAPSVTTPTPSCGTGSGTLSSTIQYVQQFGSKWVDIAGTITVTTLSTCGSSILVTLPVTGSSTYGGGLVGQNVTNGKPVIGSINPGSPTFVNFVNSDGTGVPASGNAQTIVFSGGYFAP